MKRRTFMQGSAAFAASGLLPHSRAVAQARQTELGVIWNAWPEGHVTPVFDAFEKAHPTIATKVERIPFSEIFQAIEVRLQTRGPTPDIFLCDGPLTASYAVRRHLQELDPILGPAGVAAYTKAARDQGSFRGKLMSLPLFSSSQILFVNTRLFEAAGLDLPRPEIGGRWTWEQALAAALKLTDRSKGQWGLVIEQADRPYQLLPLAQSKGAQALSPDGLTATGYVDSPPFIDAMRFYAELYTRHQVSPPGVFENNLAQEIFATGRAAMFLAGIWNFDTLKSRPDLRWSVSPHPYFDGGRPATPTGSWHIGLNPRTRNKEAAEEFIRAFASPAMVELQCRLRPNPPVLNPVWDAMRASLDTPGWRIVQHELNNTAIPRPVTPGWREYEDILRLALREIQGGQDVAGRLQRAARDIDRELQKYRS